MDFSASEPARHTNLSADQRGAYSFSAEHRIDSQSDQEEIFRARDVVGRKLLVKIDSGGVLVGEQPAAKAGHLWRLSHGQLKGLRKDEKALAKLLIAGRHFAPNTFFQLADLRQVLQPSAAEAAVFEIKHVFIRRIHVLRWPD